MKRVLLLTDVNFWEKCSGNRIRISSLITFLADHVALTVVNTGPAPNLIETRLAAEYKAELHMLEKTKYLSSTGYGRLLKKFLKGRHFDTVIIEYIHSSYFLNYLIEDAKIILDAHDIISERSAEFRKFNYQDTIYELSKEEETEILKVYDHVIAICDPDFQAIKSLVGADKTLLCPHPVVTKSRKLRKVVKKISFVASAYPPNRDAIQFFIDHCWSAIIARYNIELNIYGTVGEYVKLNDHKKIFIKGYCENIDHIYDDSDIIINPVRFGAGIKIKNLEALAQGLPLITTKHGARGLEKGNDSFIIADAPDEFISAILSLVEDQTLRKTLSNNAIKFIRKEFSVKKCFQPLLQSL